MEELTERQKGKIQDKGKAEISPEHSRSALHFNPFSFKKLLTQRKEYLFYQALKGRSALSQGIFSVIVVEGIFPPGMSFGQNGSECWLALSEFADEQIHP